MSPRELEPTFLIRNVRRFHAIFRMEFLNGDRQIASHCAVGQVQRLGNLFDARPTNAQGQHVALARGERADSLSQSLECKLRIDDDLARGRPPHRLS